MNLAQSYLFPRPDVAPPTAKRLTRRGFSALLDMLYPPHCGNCDVPLAPETNLILCRPCFARVSWIESNRCTRCGDAVGQGRGAVERCNSCESHPPVFVEATCALARYWEENSECDENRIWDESQKGPMRALILSLKFGHKLHIARPLGEMLAERIRSTNLFVENAIVVPAPLLRSKLAERAYNQAQELAEIVARCLGLKMEHRLLIKIRNTPTQASLNLKERRVNLRGAFACNPKIAARYIGRPVLLIDDVITTGSTISECARALVEAGLGTVRAGSVAR